MVSLQVLPFPWPQRESTARWVDLPEYRREMPQTSRQDPMKTGPCPDVLSSLQILVFSPWAL